MKTLTIQSEKYGDQIAYLDDTDYDNIIKYRWKIVKRRHVYYAQAWTPLEGTVMMHRLVMSTPKNQIVDHIDSNGLNNQKDNLRNCTNKQNCWNQGLAINNRTGYRGVSPRQNGYVARIRVENKEIFLKWSKDIKVCATAYNEAAKKYFGEFARLNVIDTA